MTTEIMQPKFSEMHAAHCKEVLYDMLPNVKLVDIICAERSETERGVRHRVAVLVDGWSYCYSSTNYMVTLRSIANTHTSNNPIAAKINS
jgi:hypothetical protein